jgi:hypothetical protein
VHSGLRHVYRRTWRGRGRDASRNDWPLVSPMGWHCCEKLLFPGLPAPHRRCRNRLRPKTRRRPALLYSRRVLNYSWVYRPPPSPAPYQPAVPFRLSHPLLLDFSRLRVTVAPYSQEARACLPRHRTVGTVIMTSITPFTSVDTPARSYSLEEWEEQREFITRLYRDEAKSMQELRLALAQTHSFYPT